MLEYIRSKAKGWIAYLLIIIICIPFAFWGIGDYLDGSSQNIAAEVNDEEITEYQLSNIYQRLRANSESTEDWNEKQVKIEILDNLIQEIVLLQYAHDQGYRISETSIQQHVKQNEAFHVDGKFSQSQLERTLRNHGFTPQDYINELRKTALKRQVENIFKKTSISTPIEAEKLFNLINQTREAEIAILRPNSLEGKTTVSKEEIENYYSKNKNQFKTEESVTLEYIELSPDTIKDTSLTIQDADAKAYYDAHIAEYTGSERREFSHILLAQPNDKETDVKALDATIKKSMSEGVPFSKLAKLHSKDIGTKNIHGNMGWFSKDELPTKLADIVFNIDGVGKVTDLVESEYGTHLIRLTNIKNSKQKSFDESKAEIVKTLKDQKLNDFLFEQKDKLTELVFENSDSLEGAAIELDQEVKVTQPITKSGGEAPFNTAKILNKVFSDEIIVNKYNSDVVKIADNQFVAFRLKTHTPSVVQPLSEVEKQIRSILISKKVNAKATSIVNEIASELNKNHVKDSAEQQKLFKDAANKYGLEWQSLSKLNRMNSKIARPFSQQIFKSQPNADKPYLAFSEGNYHAVINLQKVNTPKNKILKADEKNIYQATIEANRSNIELEITMKQLEKLSSIEKNRSYKPANG